MEENKKTIDHFKLCFKDIINIVNKAYTEGFLTLESSRILLQINARYKQIIKSVTVDNIKDANDRALNKIDIKDMTMRELFEACKILINIAYKNKFFTIELGNNVTNLLSIISDYFVVNK